MNDEGREKLWNATARAVPWASNVWVENDFDTRGFVQSKHRAAHIRTMCKYS